MSGIGAGKVRAFARKAPREAFTLKNPEVRIETTNICNSQCIMCPREKLTRPLGVMDFDLFRSILDEAVGYGIRSVFLGGYGEPLADPLMVERIRYAKSKRLRCNFISNGSLLTEEVSRALIEAGLDEVRFSIYGTTKEVFEKVHTRLSFEKVVGNVNRLLELKGELGRRNPLVLVFFLVLEENAHQVEDFIREWEPKVDFIEVWKPHNWSDGRNYRERPEKKESCGRPFVGPIQVQWDGTVIPCCWDYNGREIMGDLKYQTIPEVLRSARYQEIREAHATGQFHRFPFCDSCDQLQKRGDVLIYSNRGPGDPSSKVGRSNSNLFMIK